MKHVLRMVRSKVPVERVSVGVDGGRRLERAGNGDRNHFDDSLEVDGYDREDE
jgi:hypothetical protein